jgi:hypothetical protein
MTTARSTQPKAEFEDEGALVVVVTGCVVVVVVAWGWLVVVVGASVVEVVVAVVGGTVVVAGGAVVVVAGGTVVVVVCAAAPPADSPRAKSKANTAKSPVHVTVRRNMVAQPRDGAPTKRGTVGWSLHPSVSTGVEPFGLVGPLCYSSGLVRPRFAPCDHALRGKAVPRVHWGVARHDVGI